MSGERLERKIDGKFIRVFPVLEEDSNEFTGNVGQINLSIYLGPAGEPGYNVQFTTDRRLEEVVDAFSDFLNPLSVVSAHHKEVAYDRPQIVSDDMKRLCDLPQDTLRRLGEVKHLFFHLELLEQDHDSSKLPHFWYEIDIEGPLLRTFGFNIDRYHDGLIETANKVTNYPIRQEEVGWLKSILNVQVKRVE